MTINEINALAERILLALVINPKVNLLESNRNIAEISVDMAAAFAKALGDKRRLDGVDLSLGEISEIQDQRKLSAIKMVRARTGMSLNAAKALVVKAEKDLGLSS